MKTRLLNKLWSSELVTTVYFDMASNSVTPTLWYVAYTAFYQQN